MSGTIGSSSSPNTSKSTGAGGSWSTPRPDEGRADGLSTDAVPPAGMRNISPHFLQTVFLPAFSAETQCPFPQ